MIKPTLPRNKSKSLRKVWESSFINQMIDVFLKRFIEEKLYFVLDSQYKMDLKDIFKSLIKTKDFSCFSEKTISKIYKWIESMIFHEDIVLIDHFMIEIKDLNRRYYVEPNIGFSVSPGFYFPFKITQIKAGGKRI